MSDQRMIDVSDLAPAEVLQALYNAARPLGLGHLHHDPEPMSLSEAYATYTERASAYFDYHKGRVMKIEIGADEIDPVLFDRDNGEGAAKAAIERLRASKASAVSRETLEREQGERG